MQGVINDLIIKIESLTFFRDIFSDEVVSGFLNLLEAVEGHASDTRKFVRTYSDFFHSLAGRSLLKGSGEICSFGDCLAEVLMYTETPASKMAEKTDCGKLPSQIENELKRELDIIGELAQVTSRQIKSEWLKKHGDEMRDTIESLPDWNNSLKDHGIFAPDRPWGDSLDRLAAFYMKHGSGIFARYKGFIWERDGDRGFLRGVEEPDPVRLGDFIGYEMQRKEIVDNTLRFLKGYPANNLLLYGDRGTGKSSTVKALLNEYHELGLRLIEVPKEYLADFNQILRVIRNRPQKFIIFIDDLSFGDEENTYTSLKAVLEGSIENKPSNILVYATTNRRHLVRERFSDRAGFGSGKDDDEIHAADTIQEKLSLADRFGMTITFTAPDQEKYLEIVEGLAKKRGIKIDREILCRKAVQWEMLYNGRSPRTALQFINWLEGSLKLEQQS